MFYEHFISHALKYLFTFLILYSSLLEARDIKFSPDTMLLLKSANEHPFYSLYKNNVPPAYYLHFENNNFYVVHDSLLTVKKYPAWVPALSVLESMVVLWSFDRYVLKENTAIVGFNSWENNLKYGWTWGKGKFGQNFFLHMVSGASYFNAARPLGYNFYQSIPYTLGGSILTEYFSENTRPEYNQLIFMPVNGIFFGEILFRLSSDILDERSVGFERVWRELIGGVLDPGRAITRMVQGKTFKVSREDEYEKEPLDFALKAGGDRINNGTKLGTGKAREILMLNFDYGDPFEIKEREIMDYFRVRFQFSNRSGGEWLANVSEQGLLCGRNSLSGKKEIFSGFFQYYDFLDNKIYNLSAMAFGAGFIARSPLAKRTDFLLNFHLAAIPFGGDSKVFGLDTAQFRDYNYGGGLETKIEIGLQLGNHILLEANGDYYWIRTYIGSRGNYLTGIIKPRLILTLLKNAEIGCEYIIYFNDKLEQGIPDLHFRNSEEKIFLAYHLKCCNKIK